MILVKAFSLLSIKKRSFTFVQDDKVKNVILSEAKNLFLEVLKVISVLKELCLLFYKYLFSINDVDTLDWLCYFAAVEIINAFHLSAFSIHLLNTCGLALLYRE